VFTVLVGINVYVFLIRPGNVHDLSKALDETRIKGGGTDPSTPPTPGGEGKLPDPLAALEAKPAAHGADAAPPAAGDQDDGPNAGRAVQGKIKENDSLGKVLERERLSQADQKDVLHALKGVLDLRTIRPGQSYTIRFDDDGKLESFELRVSPVLLYRVERGADEKLVAKKSEAKTETRVIEVSGTVVTSLADAVKARGESKELVGTLVDLFAYDLNFYSDTHPGDRFGLVIEKIYLGNEFYRYGKVLAAEYLSREGTYTAFWYQSPSAAEGAYYDEKGQNISKSFLKAPIKYARVSSGFNLHRMHPILHRVRAHQGTDFAAPVGTPVWAAASGTVVLAQKDGGAGNLVVLEHDNGLQTYYMHLSRYAKGLKAGQHVRQKQVIGYVGNSGLSTGPHLHFGVKQGGEWVDFQKMHISRGAPVASGSMADFKNTIAPRIATLARLTAPITASVGTGPSN
jgi:murein DD-endopeptidase MepM/ murein hydrolase activator NlpD